MDTAARIITPDSPGGLATLGVPGAFVRGAGFEKKVRAAIRVWLRLEPHGKRAIAKVAKQKREALFRGNGCSDTGDISLSAVVPATLATILRMDPAMALTAYGEDCAIGERNWDSHNSKLMDILLRLLPECKVSSLEGAPSRRGWC